VAAVKAALKGIPEVIEAQVQLKDPEAIISMETAVSGGKLQQALSAVGNYHITEREEDEVKPSAREKKKVLHKTLDLLAPKKACCK
jgi:hypothetical protein